MIYRGPGFLAVVRFGSYPSPSPHLLFMQSSCVFTGGIGGRSGGGLKSYDGEKAWSSMNHLILSDKGPSFPNICTDNCSTDIHSSNIKKTKYLLIFISLTRRFLKKKVWSMRTRCLDISILFFSKKCNTVSTYVLLCTYIKQKY
jgi:hypothetical protein